MFWIATRGKARVFLLGFGEAKDDSWFTPVIRKAFEESSELWLEVGSETSQNQDPKAKQADAELMQQLEHESGRTLFDVLQPKVRERTLAFLPTVGITPESVETLRPWKAFYAINGAFWSKTKLPYEEVYIDQVLPRQAKAQGKRIRYEQPSRLDIARFMAGMSDAAQSEYIDWLLDYIEEFRNGTLGDAFDWISGNPAAATRSLDRMRTKMPDLYQPMQVQRNQWWAQKINELLGTEDTYFIAIGMLHVLGPDGIPRQLEKRGIVAPQQLRENPEFGRLG
jgi:hypothetical protein